MDALRTGAKTQDLSLLRLRRSKDLANTTLTATTPFLTGFTGNDALINNPGFWATAGTVAACNLVLLGLQRTLSARPQIFSESANKYHLMARAFGPERLPAFAMTIISHLTVPFANYVAAHEFLQSSNTAIGAAFVGLIVSGLNLTAIWESASERKAIEQTYTSFMKSPNSEDLEELTDAAKEGEFVTALDAKKKIEEISKSSYQILDSAMHRSQTQIDKELIEATLHWLWINEPDKKKITTLLEALLKHNYDRLRLSAIGFIIHNKELFLSDPEMGKKITESVEKNLFLSHEDIDTIFTVLNSWPAGSENRYRLIKRWVNNGLIIQDLIHACTYPFVLSLPADEKARIAQVLQDQVITRYKNNQSAQFLIIAASSAVAKLTGQKQ